MAAAPAHQLDTPVVLSSEEEPDRLVAARQAFFAGPHTYVPRTVGRPPAGYLERLLAAEYGRPRPHSVPTAPDRLSREDAAVASLRRFCRLHLSLTPEALLAHARGGRRAFTVLAELWPETVRRHGADHAEEVLRDLLLRGRCDPVRLAFLLDCAESADLRPLSAAEAVVLVPAGDRTARHALWRYLHHLPGGPAHLPGTGTATDSYERLLLDPPDRLTDGEWTGTGLVVAQSMLQGGLDTPGQGASGGMSVLLGGVGDELARTEGIASVVTVVTAGREDLRREPALLRARRPGHWVLRLPVDAPGAPQPDEWPAHRAALVWWAVRLLRALPRPAGVFHLRFADDGSLALAHAAARTGARICFTAAPDPHRTLARTYADTVLPDAGADRRLRADLHRVFCADQLVDRADTVIGIPGRPGTGELLRHFPALAHRYGLAGPTAPPECVALYEPADDEPVRRRRMLDSLYADGDRPYALAPADRSLPLLLCVGRLHPVKQQDLLVRTWLGTQLWRRSTLVLIGGGTDRPTAAEQEMREALGTLLTGQHAASRRLAMLPAMPNDEVRRLERALADPAGGVPAWYVCPSAKEEFGIAVLEAMEAGLPAAGPLNGGVGHYLADGVNGLLMDTSSAVGLARGLRRLVTLSETRREAMGRAARSTVVGAYSVTDMATALAREYRTVAEEDARDAAPRP
ncbi:glycosyltransferase [Streptomyces sp. NPDC004111]|uniref:glycosyltransferase n=1 Tax=Streptomyces sp. NPDC004111 TaxID=3364690 RepID=UPI003677CC8E